MLAKNKEHSTRPKGDRRLCFERVMRRLASQAVPSPNPVGFYHCGTAIGSLITKVGLVTYFYFAKVRERVCFYLFKSIESIAAGGQPQGLSLQTVGNRQFENFVPLTRQRYVEVATPYAPIKLCRFRGQMISAPTYFERSETNPSVALRQLPFRGRQNIFYNDTQFTHQQNQPAQGLYQAGWLSLLSVRRRV